jgi:hypothetical protein
MITSVIPISSLTEALLLPPLGNVVSCCPVAVPLKIVAIEMTRTAILKKNLIKLFLEFLENDFYEKECLSLINSSSFVISYIDHKINGTI